ncbi:MAG: YbaB/EbfC family nucleoid-associated protein [Gammaproteobacteria bacterium]|nr:YbaB/EbfC family nucleoid-associated protein [Gammaproteobacteria bacterium]
MSDKLLSDIQSSIMDMQSQMQSTYKNLADIIVSGESFDKTVKIIMTATYTFVDIEFTDKALQGGVKEFKLRIRESWENVVKKIQEATQSKTMELLQQMQIPDEIKNLSMPTDQKAIEKDEDQGK